MIQDITIKNGYEYDLVADGDVFCTGNLETGELKILDELEGYKDGIDIRGYSFFCNRKTIYITYDAKHIVVINGNTIKYINTYMEIDELFKLYGCAMCDDKIYIFPRQLKKIYIFECENMVLKSVENKQLFDYLGKVGYFRNIDNRYLLVVGETDKKALIYDTLLNTNEYIVFDETIKNVIDMKIFEGVLYTLSEFGEVCDVEISTGKRSIIVNINCEKRNGYGSLFVGKNNIIVLPYLDNDIYVINRQTKRVEKVDYPTDFRIMAEKNQLDIFFKYCIYSENEDVICYSNTFSNYIVYIDKKKEVPVMIQLPISNRDLCKYHMRYKKPVINYEEKLSLKEYIRVVCGDL